MSASSLRTLAIDLGARRVGLAISDDGGRLATPLAVLDVASVEAALPLVARQVNQQEPSRVLVGLPLNMDGSHGPAAKKAVHWGQRLQELIGKPVIFVDERLSSFEADQQLSDRRKSGQRLTHKKKKQRRDALAAAAFLQEFLDGAKQAR